MKIIGLNSAVTTYEDIIPQGGTLSVLNAAEILQIASDSIQDDNLVNQQETATFSGTIGEAGAGNAKVTVTSVLLETPFEFAVAVANSDTASQVAGKARAAAATHTEITDLFTISGATTKLILTNKVARANDTTFNIAIDNDTCSGLTAAPTSENTTAGGVGTGALTVKVTGVNESFKLIEETVSLNGQTSVETTNKFIPIKLEVETAGTGLKNAGTISATAKVSQVVVNKIEASANISQQAIFIGEPGKTYKIKNFNISAYNATSGAITYIYVNKKIQNGVQKSIATLQLNADNSVLNVPDELFTTFNGAEFIIVSANVSAGSSSVVVNFDCEG